MRKGTKVYYNGELYEVWERRGDSVKIFKPSAACPELTMITTAAEKVTPMTARKTAERKSKSNTIPRKFYRITARQLEETSGGKRGDIWHIYRNYDGLLGLNTSTGLYYNIPAALLRNPNIYEFVEIDKPEPAPRQKRPQEAPTTISETGTAYIVQCKAEGSRRPWTDYSSPATLAECRVIKETAEARNLYNVDGKRIIYRIQPTEAPATVSDSQQTTVTDTEPQETTETTTTEQTPVTTTEGQTEAAETTTEGQTADRSTAGTTDGQTQVTETGTAGKAAGTQPTAPAEAPQSAATLDASQTTVTTRGSPPRATQRATARPIEHAQRRSTRKTAFFKNTMKTDPFLGACSIKSIQ